MVPHASLAGKEELEAPKVNHPEGMYPSGGEWLRKGEPRRTGLISDYHRLPARLRLHSTCAQWSLVVSGCAIEVDEHSGGAAGFGAAPGG